MSLPQTFQFNQGNLQDYVDCRRRFQLRYLLKVAWPALESEPVQESEQWMRQGARFHRILQQVFTGLPVESISAQAMDADLMNWWINFQTHVPGLLDFDLSDLPQTGLIPEISLAAQLGGFRLIGKFDLLVNHLPEKITIIDWKTSRKATRRERQAARIQTQLYPYLLVQSGNRWNQGKALQPEQVEMLYWYAVEPDRWQRFNFDARQFEKNQVMLSTLVHEIAQLPDDEFFMTTHEDRCRYCVYRSLCDRGIAAGQFDDQEAEADVMDLGDIEFDFEQITEIEI